jgi:hypothetical protein
MANYNTMYSAVLNVGADKIQDAQKIIDKISAEIFEEDGQVVEGVQVQNNTVWFWHGDSESGNLEYAARIAEVLVDDLDLELPFIISWADICTKPYPNEFGGGICVIEKGKGVKWFNTNDLRELVLNNKIKD